MDVRVSVFLFQIIYLVQNSLCCLNRLGNIHVADGETKIGAVVGQELAIGAQLTLLGEVDEMAHAKVVHSSQFFCCQLIAPIAGIFTGKQIPIHMVRLMKRTTDKSLKAVVDVKQVGGEQGAALCNELVAEFTAGHLQTFCAGNGGCHRSNGVRITTHGNGKPQRLLSRMVTSFKISLDGNGHTALTGDVKTVGLAEFVKIEIKVVSNFIFNKTPNPSSTFPTVVLLQEYATCDGLCSLDALRVVVGNRSRDARQLQCFFKRVGIQSDRTHTHGRTVAETAVGAGIYAQQPRGKPPAVAGVNVFPSQSLHDFHQSLRTVLRVGHQPFCHGERHDRVVCEPAAFGN